MSGRITPITPITAKNAPPTIRAAFRTCLNILSHRMSGSNYQANMNQKLAIESVTLFFDSIALQYSIVASR